MAKGDAAVHNLGMATAKNYARIVRQVQAETRENQSELARRFGVSQPTISRWLAGNPPELHHSTIIEAVAEKLGILNLESSTDPTAVKIVGYVGAGGTVLFSDGQGPFGEAEMPPIDGSDEMVAVTVRGDSMSGMLEDGWTLYYNNRRVPPDNTFFNKLCIVALDDGRILVKKLYPGRKPRHFDLHSTNAPPLLDQAVEWAAKVAWIAVK